MHIHELEGNPFAAKMAEVYERLEKVSQYASLTPAQKAQYDAVLKWYWDTYEMIATAKEDGMEMGIKEGREMVIKEGIKEERRLIVETMRKNGLSDELISQYTNIPLNEIEKY